MQRALLKVSLHNIELLEATCELQFGEENYWTNSAITLRTFNQQVRSLLHVQAERSFAAPMREVKCMPARDQKEGAAWAALLRDTKGCNSYVWYRGGGGTAVEVLGQVSEGWCGGCQGGEV